MTTVSTPSFEVRDNPLTEANGHRLVSIDRRGTHTTSLDVNDAGQCVALRTTTNDGMGFQSSHLSLTPDEARALAGALIEVARFVDEAGE
jgi:hypothetical protein